MKTVKRTGIALAIALTFPLALPATTAAQTSLTNSKAATMTEKHGQFIAVGKVVQVTFGDFAFKLDFTDDKTMTFTGIGEASQGITDTVQYTAVEIRPKVYMVYWHEPQSGDNVTHIEDFERGEVYTNIAAKDGSFTHLKGQLKIVGHSGN
ncbi:MoaF-related domain-containing protein [Serratia ureilytica]|uniref:MoaF-related domain-containing protein n=1 Tax=Serratia ureilytica TaxID=300181 RepID=UPI003FA7C764